MKIGKIYSYVSGENFERAVHEAHDNNPDTSLPFDSGFSAGLEIWARRTAGMIALSGFIIGLSEVVIHI